MAQRTLSDAAYSNVAAYVRTHVGGTLTWRQLDQLCGTPSSNLQHDLVVGPLVSDGVLEAASEDLIKGSEKRPIYRSYRIAEHIPDVLPASGAFMIPATPDDGGSAADVRNDNAAGSPAPHEESEPVGEGSRRGSRRTRTRSTYRAQANAQAKAQEKGHAAGQDLSGYLGNLSPQLTQNGYLANNLSFAKAWHKELREVGAWLDALEGPAEPVLLEERSYEIFRNEKLLSPRADAREGVRLYSLLKSVGVMDRLAILEIAPTLQHYLPYTLRKNLCMLIVENHVPYVRIQEELKRGRRRFFGRHVDGVIYGAGSAVSKDGVLDETERLFTRGGPVRYLYWGDIDRPGILAYEQLREAREIELLMGAYEAMLDAGVDEDLPVAGGATRLLHNGIDLADRLNRARLETYLRVIADDLRIPQEAVPSDMYCGGPLAERRMRPTSGMRSALPWR